MAEVSKRLVEEKGPKPSEEALEIISALYMHIGRLTLQGYDDTDKAAVSASKRLEWQNEFYLKALKRGTALSPYIVAMWWYLYMPCMHCNCRQCVGLDKKDDSTN